MHSFNTRDVVLPPPQMLCRLCPMMHALGHTFSQPYGCNVTRAMTQALSTPSVSQNRGAAVALGKHVRLAPWSPGFDSHSDRNVRNFGFKAINLLILKEPP